MRESSYCLRLIDSRIADSIRRSSPRQRRLFAVRCAIEAMNHLRNPEGDDAAEALRELLSQRLFSDASEDDVQNECVPVLSEVEDQVYAKLVQLRSVYCDMEVPYKKYVAVANVWHAVRAQKFAMMSDSIVAAGMATFEASFVVPDADACFLLLARELLGGDGTT